MSFVSESRVQINLVCCSTAVDWSCTCRSYISNCCYCGCLLCTCSPGMLLSYCRCIFRWMCARRGGSSTPATGRHEPEAWSLELACSLEPFEVPRNANSPRDDFLVHSSRHQLLQHGSWNSRVVLGLTGTGSGARLASCVRTMDRPRSHSADSCVRSPKWHAETVSATIDPPR